MCVPSYALRRIICWADTRSLLGKATYSISLMDAKLLILTGHWHFSERSCRCHFIISTRCAKGSKIQTCCRTPSSLVILSPSDRSSSPCFFSTYLYDLSISRVQCSKRTFPVIYHKAQQREINMNHEYTARNAFVVSLVSQV